MKFNISDPVRIVRSCRYRERGVREIGEYQTGDLGLAVSTEQVAAVAVTSLLRFRFSLGIDT